MTMLRRAWLAMLLLASASAAPAQRPAAASSAGFEVQVLALPSIYTAKPAWGREPLMAVRYTPASGEVMHGPAIVFVDAAIGAHPLEPGTASRFAAERLAARGYTVLAIFPRTDRAFGNTPFRDAALDVQSALDYLEAQGHEDLILASNGSGAAAIAAYVATQDDFALDMPGAKRVKALIMVAPPADDPRSWPGVADEGYDTRVARARTSIAAPAPASKDPLEGQTVVVTNGLIQSPAMFLDYFGPQADTRLSKWMPKVQLPVLVMQTAADVSSPAGREDEIRAAAGSGATVTAIRYADGRPDFGGAEDRVAIDIISWLQREGLGPRPDVRISLLDQAMVDGSQQAATFYAPKAGIDPAKPVFLLQFGTGGDVLHSATQWLAWRLAERGYAVLSPRSRMAGGRGLNVATYAEQRADLLKWLDLLAARGHKHVVLEGHSLGGILVSNVAATGDPRVAGLVYLAPTRDSPTRAREGQGTIHYAGLVGEARAAVARGDGERAVISYKSYPAWAKDNHKPSEGMKPVSGDTSLAKHFLDFRGPDAPLHTQVVGRIKVPAIGFAATDDPLLTRAFMNDFQHRYGGRFTPVWYSGSHGARESKTLIADTIARWAVQTFTTSRPYRR